MNTHAAADTRHLVRCELEGSWRFGCCGLFSCGTARRRDLAPARAKYCGPGDPGNCSMNPDLARTFRAWFLAGGSTERRSA